jgi:hypothetical protein
MKGRERPQWILRAAGQASVYFVFLLALVELLRRERVVTLNVLTPRTLVAAAILWSVVVCYRAVRERLG